MKTKQTILCGLIAVVLVLAFTALSLTGCEQPNDPTAPTLTGIALDTALVKKAYVQNEQLNLTGLVVIANYSDSTSAPVTTFTTDPVHGATLSETETITVTVSYTEGLVTKTDNFTITVAAAPTADITYTAIQTGGADKTDDSNGADTTGIVFTFSASVDSLNLSADDITIGDEATKGALSGTGTTRTLAITVTHAGQTTVQITKTGIEAETKNVTVYKEGEITPPHTHTYSAVWSSDATQHWRECTANDGAKTDEAAHTAGDWIVDQAATATTAGSKHKECTVCGYETETETIPATGEVHTHNWGAWEETTPATCTDAGVETRTCTLDPSHTDTRAIAINPNAHNYKWINSTATVSEDGLEYKVCQNNNNHTDGSRTAYATGTAGLAFERITSGSNANTYRVRKGTVNSGTVYIPAYSLYNDEYLPVTEIGSSNDYLYNGAFYGSSMIAVIFTENSRIQTIGSYAFSSCYGLTGITLSTTVTSIGRYAFYYCDNLASINIPAGVTEIGEAAFYSCTGLTGITIPEGVTEIGRAAFSGCSGLTGITILEGVTEIGSTAFSRCSGLTGITLPTTVTSIGSGAFSGCDNLASINIPAGVTEIGRAAFSGCSGLTGITLPTTVTTIGQFAFYNCTSLTSITIPEGVTEISRAAFSGCTGLTSITIGAGVTAIDNMAFFGCDSLATVTFAADSRLQTIDTQVFQECTSLTNITIPASVTSIGNWAFDYCTSLTSVTFTTGSQLQTIGLNVFRYCSSLTTITIPAGVTSIGGAAFYGCTGLTEITIPASVTSIGGAAFNASSIIDITVDTGNPNYASEGGILYNKTKTEFISFPTASGNVTIPAGVTSIGISAFNGCTGLTAVTIPAGVTSIGYAAFRGCTGLTSITIPASVTTVGGNAFSLWTDTQTICIEGFASEVAADAAWNETWRNGCNATIKYAGEF